MRERARGAIFIFIPTIIAQRNVKEINRGMRPRRIFTRFQQRGRAAALVKHFLIKSKSIAPLPDACLRSVAERAVKRREREGERRQSKGDGTQGCVSGSSFFGGRFDIRLEIPAIDGNRIC